MFYNPIDVKNEKELLFELIMVDRGWEWRYDKLKTETLHELVEYKNEDYPTELLFKAYKEMGWDITEAEIRTLFKKYC